MKAVTVILSPEEGYHIYLTDEDYDGFQMHMQTTTCEPLDSTQIAELESLSQWAVLEPRKPVESVSTASLVQIGSA